MVHYLTNSIIEMNHSTNYTRIKQIAKGSTKSETQQYVQCCTHGKHNIIIEIKR